MLQNYLPPKWRGQIAKIDVNSIHAGCLSDANGSPVSVAFSAQVQEDPNVTDKTSWPREDLLLSLNPSGDADLKILRFPQGISGLGAPNHNLVCLVRTTLLLPVDFKQVAPYSGFDWVQSPHWLMVPTGSTNQAIAVTPASSNLTVNFSIQPNSSGSQLSVSPTSTTSSNQTITVTSSGTNTGESYQVQVGVGTTNASGTNSAGLCLDVKPRTTGTIAIHAVTQHYTQPMAPPSVSGSFTPGTVCITWTHVENTTPVPPDHDGPYGSGEILTGSDGICHTTAASGDTQVIPVGQGIPADLAPQDTPTQGDLQNYLNQVFGKQANLLFVVTRSDFTCNYDLNTNGMLEISPLSHFQTSEEKVVSNHADPTAEYNIYYVKDFDSTAILCRASLTYLQVMTRLVRLHFFSSKLS